MRGVEIVNLTREEELDAQDSAEFLSALVNGQPASTERIVKLVDWRFRSIARRQRETRQEVRMMSAELASHLRPLVLFVRFVKRAAIVAPVLVGVAAALVAIAKGVGWL